MMNGWFFLASAIAQYQHKIELFSLVKHFEFTLGHGLFSLQKPVDSH